MKLVASVFALSTYALLAPGCGGSSGSSLALSSGSDGGRCPAFAACGGTITPGTYTITSFCEHSDPLPADSICQGATVSISGVDLSGTLTFSDATNHFTYGNETIHSVLYMPASCMGNPAGPTTCSDLQQRLEPDPASTSTTAIAVTCSGTSSCTCMEAGNKTISAAGTYSAPATDLTFSPNDNSGSDISGTPIGYCVSGTQIALSATKQDGAAGVSLSMVLKRL
jgi:hypothetical protein